MTTLTKAEAFAETINEKKPTIHLFVNSDVGDNPQDLSVFLEPDDPDYKPNSLSFDVYELEGVEGLPFTLCDAGIFEKSKSKPTQRYAGWFVTLNNGNSDYLFSYLKFSEPYRIPKDKDIVWIPVEIAFTLPED